MNELTQYQPAETAIEVVASSALESMERASIDMQVTTARKYPRSLSAVKAKMLSFATLDVETASGCFFTLPARAGGDGKAIQGPSIRMAEIALSTYQNLRAGARVISDDGKVITAQGVCHDLENNVSISVEVKRRVTNKKGQRYSDDMVVMTGNAACAIALRNATFRVVPLALVKPVYEQAKRVAIGDAKTLATRRADALGHFAKMGVDKDKVFRTLGVKAAEDIGLEELETLIGYATAIKDGETSVDEVFTTEKAVAPKFEPIPARTSKQATVEAPEQAAQEPAIASGGMNTAKALRGLLTKDSVNEETFLSWWRVEGPQAAAEVKTIEEAVTVSEASLKKCMDNWANAVGMMKA